MLIMNQINTNILLGPEQLHIQLVDWSKVSLYTVTDDYVIGDNLTFLK